MSTYPQLARDITELRKRGDLEGAIAKFKAAPDSERRRHEVRSAMGWVIYDRDVKPCSATDIDVTDVMIDAAINALPKIRTWCRAEPNGQYSAYPTSLLSVAKVLKARIVESESKGRPNSRGIFFAGDIAFGPGEIVDAWISLENGPFANQPDAAAKTRSAVVVARHESTLSLRPITTSLSIEGSHPIRGWAQAGLKSPSFVMPGAIEVDLNDVWVRRGRLSQDDCRHLQIDTSPVVRVDAVTKLLDVLDTDDALDFSRVRSGAFPSALERWVGYALDVCKHILSAENATRSRLDRAEPLLSKLAKLQERGYLSREKPTIEVNGKKRTTPSALQRYFLQSSSYYLDIEQFDRVVEVCSKALASGAFDKDSNRKWLIHRLAKANAVIDPTRALVYADEFIALEYKPYALMLKAEILEKLGRNEEALKEVAHSLQIITEQDLPYITANLMLVAKLSNDPVVQRAHVQMTRAIRSERGWGPAPDVEAFAQKIGLRADEPAPDTKDLRSMWSEMNPQVARPTLPNQGSTGGQKARISPKEIGEFIAQTDDRGTVGLAFLPDKTGQRRRTPVVVVGTKGNQYLVGMVQTTSKHPNVKPITDWSKAGLRQQSLFVPFYVAIPKKDLLRLGTLTEQDLKILP